MSNDAAVTITIRRRVRPGHESAFEEALRAFIPLSMLHPGHLGVQVLRPTPPAPPEWIVVIKFQTRAHYETFRTTEAYQQWTAQLRELLIEDPVYEEQCGLESWFVLPGATALPVLPRWKMAIVTWVGVNIAVFSLAFTVLPWISEWPYLPRQLLLDTLAVALLAWLIMPILTRIFKPLLYPGQNGRAPETQERPSATREPSLPEKR